MSKSPRVGNTGGSKYTVGHLSPFMRQGPHHRQPEPSTFILNV